MIEFDPVLVHEWLSRSARLHPQKAGLIFKDATFTYAELENTSNSIARFLIEKGVMRGDRIIIFMDNCPEAIIALFGILKAGCAFVILDNTLKAPKLHHIIEDAGAKIIFTQSNKVTIVYEALTTPAAGYTVVCVGNDTSASVLKTLQWYDILETSADTISLPRIIDVDLAALIYTSGSTGEPKGIICTHYNIISAARSIIQYIGNNENDIILNVLPLSFDYGLYQVIMSVMFGGTIILEKTFLYIEKVLQLLSSRRITGFPIVPTILSLLLRHRSFSNFRLDSLRYITNTGAALPEKHIRRLRTLFPHISVFSMFGLTECKRICYLPPEKIDRFPLSVGNPMPNCDIQIVDKNGEQVPPGKTGQLIVRGSNVMQGYWNDPEKTESTFHSGKYPAERYLYTGDFFKADRNGHLYFIGRKDNMIKSRGERVSTKEIEDVLLTIQEITDAVVLPEPDEILGNSISVCIVTTQDSTLTAHQVLKECSKVLEKNKIPQKVYFLDNLPRLINGKIDVRRLKKEVSKKM